MFLNSIRMCIEEKDAKLSHTQFPILKLGIIVLITN